MSNGESYLIVKIGSKLYAYTAHTQADYWFDMYMGGEENWNIAQHIFDPSQLPEREQFAYYQVHLLGDVW